MLNIVNMQSKVFLHDCNHTINALCGLSGFVNGILFLLRLFPLTF